MRATALLASGGLSAALTELLATADAHPLHRVDAAPELSHDHCCLFGAEVFSMFLVVHLF